MKIYLSGPITGIQDKNAPLFDRIAAELRQKLYEVVNPMDLGRQLLWERKASCFEDIPYEDYMSVDLAELVTCDVVLLLPGWIHSKGCRREVAVAQAHKIPVLGKHENLFAKLDQAA